MAPPLGRRLPDAEGDAVPRANAVLFRPADAECPELRVWSARDVLAILRSFAAEEVNFDVYLRELQGQERLDVLCLRPLPAIFAADRAQ